MNDFSQSKIEFMSILSNINRKFEIVLSKWITERDYEIRFRTEIEHNNHDYNGLCDQWVDEFSNVTNTTWIKKISNTGPKIVFRKQYQCWTGPNNIKKEFLFDASRCRAVLDMKVLNDSTATRKKNKYLRLGLNALIKINFNHLHLVNNLESFSFFVHNCLPHPECIDECIDSVTNKEIGRKRIKIKQTRKRFEQCQSVNSFLLNNNTNALMNTAVHHFTSLMVNKITSTSENSGESMLMYTPTFLFDNNRSQLLPVTSNNQTVANIPTAHVNNH